MTDRELICGIAWYLPGDYGQARALMADADSLPETFAEWLRRAEEAERKMQDSGHRVVRAILDPFEFSIWCRDNGAAADADGRAQFASWVARHRDTGYG